MCGGHGTAPLSARQREVLSLIQRVVSDDPLHRPPSVLNLATRLGLHHSVVQDHLKALWRKGYLYTPTPSGLRCCHGHTKAG